MQHLPSDGVERHLSTWKCECSSKLYRWCDPFQRLFLVWPPHVCGIIIESYKRDVCDQMKVEKNVLKERFGSYTCLNSVLNSLIERPSSPIINGETYSIYVQITQMCYFLIQVHNYEWCHGRKLRLTYDGRTPWILHCTLYTSESFIGLWNTLLGTHPRLPTRGLLTTHLLRSTALFLAISSPVKHIKWELYIYIHWHESQQTKTNTWKRCNKASLLG